MPKAKSKKTAPVQPIAPTPPPEPVPVQEAAPPPDDRVVVYPSLEINECSTTSKRGPLTIAMMKKFLGWETEKEYQTRIVKEEHEKGNMTAKPEHYLFGEDYHCRNVAGEKVCCHNNNNNRRFDDAWAEALEDTILYGRWAGPFTMKGDWITVNGETIRISRWGEVISGQHQMTGCIRAGEKLAKARADGEDKPGDPKYPVWAKHAEPFLETIVITGMSDDPRVLMTVDYVKPRTTADMFYTSKVFRDCTPPQRNELCRMLAQACDLLWTRTKAQGYRTHPEMVGFLDRHESLLKCVLHLFGENSAKANRGISKLRLSAGNCSALMYLMASSGPGTDLEYGDFYRNPKEGPPTEKNLDWTYWDKAEEFWTLLATGVDFDPVRDALGRLIVSNKDDENNVGMGGRGPEKLALIANAWLRWKDHTGSGAVFDAEDMEPGGLLCLSYTNLDSKGNKLPNGQIDLVDIADFFGIDCPEVGGGKVAKAQPPDPTAPTPEALKKMYEANDERRRAAMSAKK